VNKFAWLLSLLPPFLSLILLRSYLGFFDNASLFTENLTATGLFSFVFIFIALTVVGMGLIFFLPSLIFILSIPKKADTLFNYSEVKARITFTLTVSLPLTLFTLFIWAFLSDRYPAFELLTGWFFTLTGLMSVFLLNYLFLKTAVKAAQAYQKSKSRRKTALQLYFGSPLLILATSLLFSSVWYETILGWVDTKAAGDSFYMMLKVAGLLSLLGIFLMLPGMIYVNTESDVKNFSWHLKFISVTGIFWIFLTGMYIPSFYPVFVDKTLSLAGVSDWKTRRYQVDESKIPAAHFSSPDWHTASLVPGKYYSLQGMMVYSLNNVRLLCPESVRDTYRDMLSFVPWDREHDRNMAKRLKEISVRCQSFSQGGILRLSEK